MRPASSGRPTKEASMPTLSRSVPHADLEPCPVQGVVRNAAVLIFDLFGVRKSKARRSARFLQLGMQGNQNPMSDRSSDINQSFFIIRAPRKISVFCARKSEKSKPRSPAAAAAFDFELFWEIKHSAEILGFLQKEIKEIKQFKRRCPQTGNPRRAEANLILNQAGKNQVSAETLGFIQVGNQEIKFER